MNPSDDFLKSIIILGCSFFSVLNTTEMFEFLPVLCVTFPNFLETLHY